MKKLEIVIDTEIKEILKQIVEDCFLYNEIKIDWDKPLKCEINEKVEYYNLYYKSPFHLVRFGSFLQIARDKAFKEKLQQLNDIFKK